MTLNGRPVDSRYPYEVKPALRFDPDPPAPLSTLVSIAIGGVIIWALAIRLALFFVYELRHPLH